jgi:acyl carrier protein
MSTGIDVRDALRQWIADASSKRSAQELTDDTPLFRSGILKSVQISDLILTIEELAQRPVDVEQIKPGVFSDIDTIYRNFFAHDHAR